MIGSREYVEKSALENPATRDAFGREWTSLRSAPAASTHGLELERQRCERAGGDGALHRRAQKEHFLSHPILRTPVDPVRGARCVALSVQMSVIRKVVRIFATTKSAMGNLYLKSGGNVAICCFDFFM